MPDHLTIGEAAAAVGCDAQRLHSAAWLARKRGDVQFSSGGRTWRLLR